MRSTDLTIYLSPRVHGMSPNVQAKMPALPIRAELLFDCDEEFAFAEALKIAIHAAVEILCPSRSNDGHRERICDELHRAIESDDFRLDEFRPVECPGHFYTPQETIDRVSDFYCRNIPTKPRKYYLGACVFMHSACKAAALFKKLLKIDAVHLNSPPVSLKTHRDLYGLPVAIPVADQKPDSAVKAAPVHYIRFTFAMFNSAMPLGLTEIPSVKINDELLFLFDESSTTRLAHEILPRAQVYSVVTEVFRRFILELQHAFKDDSNGAKSQQLQDSLCAPDLYYRFSPKDDPANMFGYTQLLTEFNQLRAKCTVSKTINLNVSLKHCRAATLMRQLLCPEIEPMQSTSLCLSARSNCQSRTSANSSHRSRISPSSSRRSNTSHTVLPPTDNSSPNTPSSSSFSSSMLSGTVQSVKRRAQDLFIGTKNVLSSAHSSPLQAGQLYDEVVFHSSVDSRVLLPTIVDIPVKQSSAPSKCPVSTNLDSDAEVLSSQARSRQFQPMETVEFQPMGTDDETQCRNFSNLSEGSSDNSEPPGSCTVRDTANELGQVVTTSICVGLNGDSPLAHASSGADLSSFVPVQAASVPPLSIAHDASISTEVHVSSVNLLTNSSSSHDNKSHAVPSLQSEVTDPKTSADQSSFGIQLRPNGSTSKFPWPGISDKSSTTNPRTALSAITRIGVKLNIGDMFPVPSVSANRVSSSRCRKSVRSSHSLPVSAHYVRMARDTAIRFKQITPESSSAFAPTTLGPRLARTPSLRPHNETTDARLPSKIAGISSLKLNNDTPKACPASFAALSVLHHDCRSHASSTYTAPMSYCEAAQQGLPSVQQHGCVVHCRLAKCSVTFSTVVQPIIASSFGVASPSIAPLTRPSIGASVVKQSLVVPGRNVSLSPGHSPHVSSAPSVDTAAEAILLLSAERKNDSPTTGCYAVSSGPVISCGTAPVVAPVACHVSTAIGHSLRAKTGSSTACDGRSYQPPGFSVAQDSLNSIKLTLSTDYIASGVDSDRGGSYASLITADSIASGIDSDRGGDRTSFLIRGHIGPNSSNKSSVPLVLVPSRIQVLDDQATFVVCPSASSTSQVFPSPVDYDDVSRYWMHVKDRTTLHSFTVPISGNVAVSACFCPSVPVPTSLMHAISSIMPFDKHVAYDGRLLILPLHTLCCGSDTGKGTLRVGEGIVIIPHFGTGEDTIPSVTPFASVFFGPTTCYFSAPALRAGEGMICSCETPFAGEGFTPVPTALLLICSGVTVVGQPITIIETSGVTVVGQPVTTAVPLICSGVSVPDRARQVHCLPPDKDNALVSVVAYPPRARQVHRLPPDKGNTVDNVIHAIAVGLAPVITDSRGVVSDLPCTSQSMDPSLVLLMPTCFAAHPDVITNNLDFEIIVHAFRSCGMQSVVHSQQDHKEHFLCNDCRATWDYTVLPASHGHGTRAENAQYICSTPIPPSPVELTSHIGQQEMQSCSFSAIADVRICRSSLKKPMLFVLQLLHDLCLVNCRYKNCVSSTQRSFNNDFECRDTVIVEASPVTDFVSSMAQTGMRATLYPADSSDSLLAQPYVYRCAWSGILTWSYTHSVHAVKHATVLFILDTSHLVGMEPPWTSYGIVINELDALFFHDTNDSTIGDLYLTEAACNLVRHDYNLPNSWKWKGGIDLLYATVNVIACFMHCCQNDMDCVLETGDPAHLAIVSHYVTGTVAEWVHYTCRFSQLWSPKKIPFGCFGSPPEAKLRNSGARLTNVESSTKEVDSDFFVLSLSAPAMDSCLALNTFVVRKSFLSAWFLLQLQALPQAVSLRVGLTTLILCQSSMAQWSLTCWQYIACPLDNCGLSTPVLTLAVALYLVVILCYVKLQSPDKSVLKAIGISCGRMSSHHSSPRVQDKKKLSSCFLIILYAMLHCNAVLCHLQTIVDAVIDALDACSSQGEGVSFLALPPGPAKVALAVLRSRCHSWSPGVLHSRQLSPPTRIGTIDSLLSLLMQHLHDWS